MVNTSLPFTVPVTEKLKAIVLPLWDTEAGVADVKVAEPPLIDKLKSAASIAPLPPLVSYTASLKVTEATVLSVLTVAEVITGGSFISFTLMVSAFE